MAVAVEMRFEGGTLDQYDDVIRRMGFEPNGAGAEGGVFHWVAGTDYGLRIVDVWETMAAFEAFAASTLGPVTQSMGLAQPEMTVHQVHNMLFAPRLAAAAARS